MFSTKLCHQTTPFSIWFNSWPNFIPFRWRSRLKNHLKGARKFTIPKREPAELPGLQWRVSNVPPPPTNSGVPPGHAKATRSWSLRKWPQRGSASGKETRPATPGDAVGKVVKWPTQRSGKKKRSRIESPEKNDSLIFFSPAKKNWIQKKMISDENIRPSDLWLQATTLRLQDSDSEDSDGETGWQIDSRWFKVTFLSSSWRLLIPLIGVNKWPQVTGIQGYLVLGGWAPSGCFSG